MFSADCDLYKLEDGYGEVQPVSENNTLEKPTEDSQLESKAVTNLENEGMFFFLAIIILFITS